MHSSNFSSRSDSRVLTLNQISIMTQLPKKLLLTSLKGLIQQIPQLRDQKTDKPSSLLNRVAGEGTDQPP